ncbi:MAG: hypothetical protein ABEJ31_04685 [Haloarculaceae archaeon]
MSGAVRGPGGTEAPGPAAATDATGATGIDRGPTALASGLAVGLAAVAVLSVAGTSTQFRAVAFAVGGVLAAGAAERERFGDRPARLALWAAGLALVALALATAVTAPMGDIERAGLVPGVVGLAVLGLALAPVRSGWETPLASAGAGLVLLGVFLSGVTHGADRTALLVGTAATIAAWDAGRHAATLGRQLGRRAETRAVETYHVGATVAVGTGFVGLATLVWDVGVVGLPLEALLLLLGAAVVFLVVLYR